MSFTQADLDRLNKAIASGRLVVRDADGQTTTYRSLSELRQARDLVARELATGSSGAITERSSVGVFKRGGNPTEAC